MQLLEGIPGMRLVAISNRTYKNLEKGLKLLKVKSYKTTNSQKQLDQLIKNKTLAITSDFKLLTNSKNIDVIVEATGEVEFGAQVAMACFKNKKHLVLINAELDAT